MTCHCAPLAPQHSYFIVMVRRERGAEAIVDPEVTRREVVSRVKTREYDPERIVFIHHVHDGEVDDVMAGILADARDFTCMSVIETSLAMQLADWDHKRALRKELREDR